MRTTTHTWSRLARLFGSLLKVSYITLRLSPAAVSRNLIKSTTYKALQVQYNMLGLKLMTDDTMMDGVFTLCDMVFPVDAPSRNPAGKHVAEIKGAITLRRTIIFITPEWYARQNENDNILVSKICSHPYPYCCHKKGYMLEVVLSNSCHTDLPCLPWQLDQHQQI